MTPEQAERKRAYNREYMRERARRGTLSQRNGAAERLFCDCGNSATVVFDNAKICERCHQIDRARREE